MLEKINRIWPRIGGLIALIIIISVGFLWKTSSQISRLSLIYWLNLAILMLHEFEEYVYPGGFKNFANEKTVLSLPNPNEGAPISEKLIVVINLGAWLIFVIAALLTKRTPWFGLGMIFFNVINIVGHIIIFQIKNKGYNPGIITSFLMIPFLIYAIVFVGNYNILNSNEFNLAIIIGVITGASLPITGIIIKKRKISQIEKEKV